MSAPMINDSVWAVRVFALGLLVFGLLLQRRSKR